MAAIKIYRNEMVTFDQILLDLQNPLFDEGVEVRLTAKQFIEYRRLFVLGDVFPYSIAGKLPHPTFLEITDYTLKSVKRLKKLDERLLAVNYPDVINFIDIDKIKKFDIDNGGEIKSDNTYREIVSYISQLNLNSENLLLPREKAIQMNPAYGYHAKFYQIETYSSGRPITSMNILANDISSISFDNPIVDEKGLIHDGDATYLPVIRYSMGMGGGSQGLYYNQKSTRKFCGTFYYHEMESSIVLNLGNYRIYRNKYMCFTMLNQQLEQTDIDKIFQTDTEMNEYYRCLKFDNYIPETDEFGDDKHDRISNFIKNILPESIDGDEAKKLMYTYFIEGKPIRYLSDYSHRVIIVNPETNILTNQDTKRSNYLDELYADEDQFDQPICKMSRYLNIDCIFLTHMIGKTRIVGEIMDTRERDDSFRALRLLPKGK